MALQIYKGCSGSGKSYELYKHIIDESLIHPELTYLILVPEQYNLSTQRRLISMHPAKGILNIDVLSFTRLAHRVFEEVGYSRAKGATIDDIGKNLILRHISGKNEDSLTVLSGMVGKLGYISEVKSVISEFMQYGIGEKELEGMIEKSSGRSVLNAKLKDISLLYSEFRKYIKEKYITTEEILDKVSDAIPDSARLKKSVIVLDGYTGFTPVQLRLIETLLENCVDVYVTLLYDVSRKTDISETDLFHLSHKTIGSLEGICADKNIKRLPDIELTDPVPARFRFDENGSVIDETARRKELIHLERNLFRKGGEIFGKAALKDTGPSDDEHSIHIFAGTDPYEEAVEAAVRIERLIREEGYRYKDIAVVSGDMDTYANACRRAFVKYDIPFFADRTIPVLHNPLIEYIRSVFDVVTDNYSYEAMFRLLRTGFIERDRDLTDRLENYVLRYGIKGRKAWNNGFVRKPRDMETDELKEIDGLREKTVNSIGLFVDELKFGADIEGGSVNGRKFDVKAVSTALYHFMVKASLAERAEELRVHFEEAGDGARAKEYGSIYEEVCVLLDKMVSLLPDEKITLKEYAQLLDAGFAEIRTGVIPGSDDYVQIGDITRTRLRDIKALFFMGVNDGVIPASSSGGGLISDMEREFLTRDGSVEMAPDLREQAYIQRLYLYMLVTKPSQHLFLSYAKLSQDGSSLAPSYFIKTVMQMFPEVVAGQPDESVKNRVFTAQTGYGMLASKLRDAIRDPAGGEERDVLSILEIFADDERYRNKMEFLADTAFSGGVFKRKDKIGRAVAAALYGKELTCSVTRLEAYARCAYSHFLKYGLSLKQRELFSFEANDIGSVFHDSLLTYALILKERGLSWSDVDNDTSDSIVEESVMRTVSGEGYDALYGSFRSKYMINRMRRITKRTVDTLKYQLEKGSFIPKEFEFSFSSADGLKSLDIDLSEDEKLKLYGRIDRLDVCEKDDRVYVKVIDYKSGNKKFDMAGIYTGLDLQLIVYLSAALEYVTKAYGKEAVPAGMLYYHIADPLINDECGKDLSDEKIEEKIRHDLKMDGLVNEEESIYRLMDKDINGGSDVIPVSVKKDGGFKKGSSVISTEEFGIISDFVNRKICEMGRRILDGDIKTEPHKRSEKAPGPCIYCDYSDICAFRDEVHADDMLKDADDFGSNDEYILHVIKREMGFEDPADETEEETETE